MKPIPIRFRLSLLSALILGAVLLLFGFIAWYLIYTERIAALDREIRALAYRHPGWMGNRPNYERLSSVIEMVFGEDRKDQLIMMAADIQHNIHFISPSWPKDLDPGSINLSLQNSSEPASLDTRNDLKTINVAPMQQAKGPPWAASSDGGNYPGRGFGRMRGQSPQPFFSKVTRFSTIKTASSAWRIGVFDNQGERFVIGLNYAEVQAEFNRMRNAFLIALPIAMLIVGMGGWWIGGRAMLPLRSITRIAESITVQGLDKRIPPSTEDVEISRLINVLNGMMDRLEASFHQATRFSADASHELKTPLAVMQGEIEQALQACKPESKEQQVFVNLMEEIQRLKTITRGLLLLSQADAGRIPLNLQPTHLSASLQELAEDVEALANNSEIQLELDIAPNIHVQADWPMLRQAILNLFTNAIHYNEPKGYIKVHLSAHDKAVSLTICNSGLGIPPEDQARIFGRFFRVDASRSKRIDGVGLGLSLAREIVRAHGGTLDLKESRPGNTCFILGLNAHQS